MANNMIRFEGADELMSALDNAIRVSESSADAVVKNNTERAKKQAQKYAPVDTWFLHDDIYTDYEPMTGYVHSPASYSGCQGSPIETDQKRWKSLVLKLSFEVGTWYNKAIRKVVLLCLKPWTLRKEKVMGLMI